MGLLSDKIIACAFILVGLTRFHGVNGTNEMKNSYFIIVSGLLLACSVLIHNHPVPSALPATFFLVMQVMTICSKYREAQFTDMSTTTYVLLVCIGSIVLALLSSKMENENKEWLHTQMLTATAAGELMNEEDDFNQQ
mgnify:CR=1 FL=1